ncbi:Hypothetical Protein FCC1311_016272 [Hondaea fermentalgiana]|uniref:DUF711 family protein n=1 Tax=Hondaea fermentalgiana TaxID=2315210 RepID=A0A2R5G4Z5_9STRA|nr:Hypothetical Protein FCC1311_016272 [Hondaea fermentalgiana]|eukprot:GBG25409.1 Hypothetical Protein FCC1311_016272 [Hondaea fermentalgiana]
MVVVRTITASLTLHKGDCEDENVLDTKMKKVVGFLARAQQTLLEAGEAKVEAVQTVRVSCNPVEEFVDFDEGDEKAVLAQIARLAAVAAKHEVGFLSLGPMRSSKHLALIPKILALAPHVNMSASAVQNKDDAPDFGRALQLADVTKQVALLGEDGQGSFRFCVSSEVPAGTPFFPASHFAANYENVCFAIGLETSSVLVQAWEVAASAEEDEIAAVHAKCQFELTTRMADLLRPLGEACATLANHEGATFFGIDASMNPSLSDPGIGHAFGTVLKRIGKESPGSALFGSTGTLSLCFLLTKSIRDAGKAAGVTLCGYSGLMLPQMEDKGIAAAAAAGAFTVQDLLLFSSVCGVGIDTVPIPGETSREKLALLFMDMWALSTKWSKPLSCRVLPVAGKKAGEETNTSNPFLCNSVVLGLT